jgi:FtsZ-binding cell division protein ZapB
VVSVINQEIQELKRQNAALQQELNDAKTLLHQMR